MLLLPRRLAFAALLFAVPMGGAATSAPAEPAAPISVAMATGRITAQPIGHYEFCQSNNAECAIVSPPKAAPRVTEYGWQVLREVNQAVNASVLPKTDFDMFGREEVWSYPDAFGDCEDYVLLKRHMLIERGFEPSDLLITVVRKPDGEGHAVLTLRSADGDYVLDNLDTEVRPWQETPYSFLKRQSSEHTGRWVTIETGSDVLVGSVR